MQIVFVDLFTVSYFYCSCKLLMIVIQKSEERIVRLRLEQSSTSVLYPMIYFNFFSIAFAFNMLLLFKKQFAKTYLICMNFAILTHQFTLLIPFQHSNSCVTCKSLLFLAFTSTLINTIIY